MVKSKEDVIKLVFYRVLKLILPNVLQRLQQDGQHDRRGA